MKRIAILGSTGSIGSQALEVIARHPDYFRASALAARNNVALLAEQANRFRPEVLSIGSRELADDLRTRLSYTPKTVAHGDAGLTAVASADAQCVLAASDGMAALDAVLGAIERGVTVALANKELAVSAGELLFARARARHAQILPVDSEHSAVFQCLVGEQRGDVAGIVLTASGGPFWGFSRAQMEAVTPEQALAHPTWQMGPKNTLDSATLMNKGLEVIEASRFFELRPDQIEVVVHRQSVAHAFVLFKDGNVKAQLAWPDMKVPIAYALAHPERLPSASGGAKTRAAIGLGSAPSTLSFEPVDDSRFPALRLCYDALRAGGTYPAVLSASNEEAGRAFLQGKVKFCDISVLVKRALDEHQSGGATLEEIRRADAWARQATRDMISLTKTA